VYVYSQIWYSVRLLDFSGGWDESYAVFGIFIGDRPSMAFHVVAKGRVQRLNRLLLLEINLDETTPFEYTQKQIYFFNNCSTATRGL
jgi:hypothetical protein